MNKQSEQFASRLLDDSLAIVTTMTQHAKPAARELLLRHPKFAVAVMESRKSGEPVDSAVVPVEEFTDMAMSGVEECVGQIAHEQIYNLCFDLYSDILQLAIMQTDLQGRE